MTPRATSTRPALLCATALAVAMAVLSGPAAAQTSMDDARAISTQIFGPLRPVDEAFGAYQRGEFLTALALALPRAENDDAAAQTLIGEIYANGLGVGVNHARAASWYGLAEKNGDPNAAFALAMMYQDGLGVPKNRQKAAELMARAAEAGVPAAQYNMALLHVEGAYAEPNFQKAAELLEAAAEAEFPEASLDFGIMLMNGAGLPPDPERGATYIRQAAEDGLPEAQVEYATMRYLGKAVPQDIESAADWYHRAARVGNPVAQNRYAKLLAAGEGVDQDLQSAAMWRALARRQGLTDTQTDELLADISSEDLSAAEARALAWPGDPDASTALEFEPVLNTHDNAGLAPLEDAQAVEEAEEDEAEFVPNTTTPAS